MSKRAIKRPATSVKQLIDYMAQAIHYGEDKEFGDGSVKWADVADSQKEQERRVARRVLRIVRRHRAVL